MTSDGAVADSGADGSDPGFVPEDLWLDGDGSEEYDRFGLSFVGAFAAVAATLSCVLWTLLFLPFQLVAVGLDLRLAERIPVAFHKGVCWLFGIEVLVEGEISRERPTLFVANHCSYFDIPALACLVETGFVAKAEIRSWPILGPLAALQNTVFISRRVADTKNAYDEITRRLEMGQNLVLFPEGTTSDGNRILTFRSALFSLAQPDLSGRSLTIQPLTIAYARQNGMPIGHANRASFSWFGDMPLLQHFWRALQSGRVTIVVRFHPPVRAADFGSRKALAQHCFAEISAGLTEALHGHHQRSS